MGLAGGVRANWLRDGRAVFSLASDFAWQLVEGLTVAHQTFTCQAYLDADGKFPSGPPILVTAADKTAAILKATEQVMEAGIDWAIVAVEPPGRSGERRQPRRSGR